VLPKVSSVEELETVTDALEAFGRAKGSVHFIATIESALALHNIGTIAAWRSVYGPEKGGQLRALLVIPLISSVTDTTCSPRTTNVVWGRRLYDPLENRARGSAN